MTNENTMRSIRELYRIGRGPSSSHTMGPERACLQMKKKYPDADGYRVVLYGSLAMTGKGHGTDRVIRETLAPLTGEVVFDRETPPERHPNMMDFILYSRGIEIANERIWSVGGGAITPDEEGNKPRRSSIPTRLLPRSRRSVRGGISVCGNMPKKLRARNCSPTLHPSGTR